MIISLNSATDHNPLPPTLVKVTGSDEILLVELQGSLTAIGDTAGQHVGSLSIDPVTNKPTLRIGHHLLDGTIQTLAKPCAVIARPNSEYPDDGVNIGTDMNRIPRDLGSDPFLETQAHVKKQPDVNDIGDQMHMDLDEPGNGDKVTATEKVKSRTKPDLDDQSDDELGLEQPAENPNIKEVSYDIITIVRKKIVFAKRPIPIVPSNLKGIGSVTVNPTSGSAGVSGTGVGAGAED